MDVGMNEAVNQEIINGGAAAEAPMQVDHLDVDELFGEDVALSLRGPSKQLRDRVDELRARGCCQGIAWSKSGTIASISPDGLSVQVRFLRASPKDGSWDLSEATTVDCLSATPSNPVVHLAWAGTSSHELAVIDATGRVAILAFSIALNKPYLLRKWENDNAEDLNAVAGCFWLNLAAQGKSYHVFHGPAMKDGATYRYETSFLHAFGPSHPNPQKSALLCVTVNGLLRLFWTQSNNRLEETRLELEGVNTSDDLITHAALHSDKNHMYVALATMSMQLRLVRVSISWGAPTGDQKLPPGGQTLNPTMQAKCLATSTWMPNELNTAPTDRSATLISRIDLIPSLLEPVHQTWSPITVFVSRNYLPTPTAAYHEMQTVVDRWELTHEAPPALHPAFQQLGNKGSGNSAAAEKEPNLLKKVEPIKWNKIVLSIHPMFFGRVLCFAFNDGTIEYRDRFTMQETYNEPNLSRVQHLSQVGFTFAEEPRCIQAALSPNNCSIVQMLDDGQIKWNPLRYDAGDVGSSIKDELYAAMVAALTVACTSATFYHINMDDILAVARPYSSKPNFLKDLLMEFIRMLKISVDYSEEPHHDALVRNQSLQLCMSIMNHIGFRGEYTPRTFSGKFAFLALNIRNIVILITIASNTPSNMREKLSPLDEHEVVEALAGCAKWTHDLIAWLSDSLFQLIGETGFTDLLQQPRFNELGGYLQSSSEVALPLVLCSTTRGFLIAACRRLQHLEQLSHKAIEFYQRKAATQNAVDPQTQNKLPHILLYKAYQRMQYVTTKSLVKANDFERLLGVLSKEISAAYLDSFTKIAQQQHAKKQESSGGQQPPLEQKTIDAQVKMARIHSELNMLVTSQPTAPLLPVLKKFFEVDLVQFRAQTNPAELFFADYSLLEVSDQPMTLRDRKKARKYVDVFRRLEMSPILSAQDLGAWASDDAISKDESGVAQWRQCVRCAAVMEDVVGSKPGFSFVLSQQRKCACGGFWALNPKESFSGVTPQRQIKPSF